MIYENLDKANEAVIAKITGVQPFLIDVVPAKTVIKELEGKVLLHAGILLWSSNIRRLGFKQGRG
jgi:hypothetical protein